MSLANRVKRLEELVGSSSEVERPEMIVIFGVGVPERRITGLTAGNITIHRATDEEPDAFMLRAQQEILELWEQDSIPLAIVQHNEAED